MRHVNVLNLGAGVQSTTLYLMGVTGEIQFEYAVFADVQEEPKAVYAHLEWMKSLNGPPIIIRTKGKLGDDLLHGTGPTKRFASIPAFTTGKMGKLAKVRRQCTSEYKIEVIDRAIRRDILGLKPRQRIPKGTTVTSIIGISHDEISRSLNITLRMAESKWQSASFPLLDRQMTRADCQKWLQKFGVPHDVPRSACVFCPYHSDAEWIRIKTDEPESWARAVQVDTDLRKPGARCSINMESKMFVHRSLKPLDQVEFSPVPTAKDDAMGFKSECEGMCGN